MDFKITQRLLLFLMLSCFSLTKLSAEPFNAQDFERDQQLFKQALVHSKSQQWEKAEAIYRDLLSRHQSWPEPKNNLAIVLLNTSRIDEARQVFEQAVSALPSFRIAHQNRSKLFDYMASQAYDKALGLEQLRLLPEMQLIESLQSNVQVLEKNVNVDVEKQAQAKPVIQDEVHDIEKPILRQVISQQLQQWASAWSEGDSESYLKHYSPQFKPDVENQNVEQWKYSRRVRLSLASGVQVSIDKLMLFIEPTGQHALIEFVQDYRSKTYSDRVLKQLFMQKQHNKWLILSERVIKTY